MAETAAAPDAAAGGAVVQAAPPIAATDCDRSAASDFDKQSPVAGVPFSQVDPKVAIPACLDAVAANPDSARLNFELGRAYDANRQYPEAVKAFLKAAGANFALAQVNLGSLYFNGQGVEKDFKEAARWDRLAADQGLAPAQFSLGRMLIAGQGVAQDKAEGQKLLRLAAAQSFAPAEKVLGDLYARGDGVDRDEGEARKWYGLAAGHGSAAARTSLEALNAGAAATPASVAAGDPAPSRAASAAASDPNAPRYREAPAGQGYPPVNIAVKAPDARISNRVAAIAIEISPIAPDFVMTGFAVNKGQCRVYIEDPTPLLRAGATAGQTQSGARLDSGGKPSGGEIEKIFLVPPPFDPPVVAALGQYMTFYVDPSACEIHEVEVLVNGFEWKWTPG